MARRTAPIVAASLTLAALLTGCGGMEENPLNVNGGAAQSAGPAAQDSGGPAAVTASLSEDPLQLGVNGAKLCSVQPALGYQEYTVLIHNETLESFTVDDVSLGSPSGVTLNSATVTPANRGGHGTHSMTDGTVMGGDEHTEAHGGGAMAGTEDMPENVFFTEPVPAVGYDIATLEYLNVVVSVSLDDDAERGTSEYVEIEYSNADGSFTGQHPLAITMDRASCA